MSVLKIVQCEDLNIYDVREVTSEVQMYETQLCFFQDKRIGD